nr:MAG TPA: Mitochondrial import receptor subunit TOM40 protein, mitochondrial protein import [Caudoviricetes sp.]DAK19445.1 MAG TPA: Mitochondrial import receptor subunit TOM40 protein, mitochondrial protein import [Caudoviricetes sp.]DAW49174.1 MAG TPA: Mitochondrial import receptor subunit TOM40 protein, mitochondrial protein import [Caudoviricetes sp.]DAX66973.1 MAG TPA: Mitochondrial import receptor subunit TOM40 protein, mitochondrial protein import [Caudoviricetes sp.]DAY38863.1 MAG TPA:
MKIEVKKAFFHWGIIPPFYNLSKSFLYLITNKLRVF